MTNCICVGCMAFLRKAPQPDGELARKHLYNVTKHNTRREQTCYSLTTKHAFSAHLCVLLFPIGLYYSSNRFLVNGMLGQIGRIYYTCVGVDQLFFCAPGEMCLYACERKIINIATVKQTIIKFAY
jgi:hypothetical protein